MVRGIGALTGLTALYVIFPNHWSYWVTLLLNKQLDYNFFADQPVWMSVLSIIFEIILIGKLFTAYGLLKLKRWGKPTALVFLLSDFILRLGGAINVWTYYDRHPEYIELAEEMKALIDATKQGGPHVETFTISMWPSYIIAVLSLVSAIILLRIKFEKINNKIDA